MSICNSIFDYFLENVVIIEKKSKFFKKYIIFIIFTKTKLSDNILLLLILICFLGMCINEKVFNFDTNEYRKKLFKPSIDIKQFLKLKELKSLQFKKLLNINTGFK